MVNQDGRTNDDSMAVVSSSAEDVVVDNDGKKNGGSEEERIMVAIRMRPLNAKESSPTIAATTTLAASSDGPSSNDGDEDGGGGDDDARNRMHQEPVGRRVWKVLSKYHTITQTTSDGKPLPQRSHGKTFFAFDRTYGESSSTFQVYEGVGRKIVHSVMGGLNGTIFAYGQTSSGKTFTMQGEDCGGGGGSGDVCDGGIIGMSARDIFHHAARHGSDRAYHLRVSFLEIYNEDVRDLLVVSADDDGGAGGGGGATLAVREDPQRGVFVDAREVVATDVSSLMSILHAGEKNRHVGSTAMNERSSRSHTIFRITVESRLRRRSRRTATTTNSEDETETEDDDDDDEEDGSVLLSTLNLVDLAGSESVRHTGATGNRQREGGKINQSLLTLSMVIAGLGEANRGHINFRDSKLTRLLQPSLSGNARMAVICCATPSELYLEETRSTLQFAARAKLVKTRAVVNEVLDDRCMVRKLRRELEEAKRRLAEASAAAAAAAAAIVVDSSSSSEMTWGRGHRDDDDEQLTRWKSLVRSEAGGAVLGQIIGWVPRSGNGWTASRSTVDDLAIRRLTGATWKHDGSLSVVHVGRNAKRRASDACLTMKVQKRLPSSEVVAGETTMAVADTVAANCRICHERVCVEERDRPLTRYYPAGEVDLLREALARKSGQVSALQAQFQTRDKKVSFDAKPRSNPAALGPDVDDERTGSQEVDGNDSMENLKASLQEKDDRLQATLLKLRHVELENASLTSVLDQMSNDKEFWRTRADESLDKKTELEKCVKELAEEKDSYAEEKVEMEHAITEVSLERTKSQADLSLRQTELESLEYDLVQLKRSNEELAEKLEEREAFIANQTCRNDLMEANLAYANDRIEELMAFIDSAETEHKARMNVLTEELAECKQHVADLPQERGSGSRRPSAITVDRAIGNQERKLSFHSSPDVGSTAERPVTARERKLSVHSPESAFEKQEKHEVTPSLNCNGCDDDEEASDSFDISGPSSSLMLGTASQGSCDGIDEGLLARVEGLEEVWARLEIEMKRTVSTLEEKEEPLVPDAGAVECEDLSSATSSSHDQSNVCDEGGQEMQIPSTQRELHVVGTGFPNGEAHCVEKGDVLESTTENEKQQSHEVPQLGHAVVIDDDEEDAKELPRENEGTKSSDEPEQQVARFGVRRGRLGGNGSTRKLNGRSSRRLLSRFRGRDSMRRDLASLTELEEAKDAIQKVTEERNRIAKDLASTQEAFNALLDARGTLTGDLHTRIEDLERTQASLEGELSKAMSQVATGGVKYIVRRSGKNFRPRNTVPRREVPRLLRVVVRLLRRRQ